MERLDFLFWSIKIQDASNTHDFLLQPLILSIIEPDMIFKNILKVILSMILGEIAHIICNIDNITI